MISELFDGMMLREEQFLVVSYTRLTSAKGDYYSNIILQDCSGKIEAKKWLVEEDDQFIFKPGNVVSITGEVLSYKGNLQIKVTTARDLLPDNVDLTRFVQHSKLTYEELKTKYNHLVELIKDDELRHVVTILYEKYGKELFSYPAAKSNHHNYLRGLATHSISMAELAYDLGIKYKLNIDLLISGALLHDIGKIIELSGPVATTYTVEGELLGHISIGYYMVRTTLDSLNIKGEKALLLEHMILSHHGKLEYGSPVLPIFKEAVLLSMIDDMDAKMELMDNVYQNIEEGNFSNRIYAMDDRVIYKPKK